MVINAVLGCYCDEDGVRFLACFLLNHGDFFSTAWRQYLVHFLRMNLCCLLADSHKHKDKYKEKEHKHKDHKKDKEREKSKHVNRYGVCSQPAPLLAYHSIKLSFHVYCYSSVFNGGRWNHLINIFLFLKTPVITGTHLIRNIETRRRWSTKTAAQTNTRTSTRRRGRRRRWNMQRFVFNQQFSKLSGSLQIF